MPTLTKLPFFSKRGKLQIVNFIFYLFIYLFIYFWIFHEIFLIKVLVFQHFDEKIPKIEQKTEVCCKRV